MSTPLTIYNFNRRISGKVGDGVGVRVGVPAGGDPVVVGVAVGHGIHSTVQLGTQNQLPNHTGTMLQWTTGHIPRVLHASCCSHVIVWHRALSASLQLGQTGGVGVKVGVAVGIPVFVGVHVAVGVAVGVFVGVRVGVRVAVGSGGGDVGGGGTRVGGTGVGVGTGVAVGGGVFVGGTRVAVGGTVVAVGGRGVVVAVGGRVAVGMAVGRTGVPVGIGVAVETGVCVAVEAVAVAVDSGVAVFCGCAAMTKPATSIATITIVAATRMRLLRFTFLFSSSPDFRSEENIFLARRKLIGASYYSSLEGDKQKSWLFFQDFPEPLFAPSKLFFFSIFPLLVKVRLLFCQKKSLKSEIP